MILQRRDTLATITLPEGLYWVDEFDDVPYAEREERTAAGLLLIFQQLKIGGQAMTLSTTDDKNWATRETVRRLHSWARTPNLKMSLVLDTPEGSPSFIVSFRAVDGKAVVATPVLKSKPLGATTEYHLALNLRIHSETV